MFNDSEGVSCIVTGIPNTFHAAGVGGSYNKKTKNKVEKSSVYIYSMSSNAIL